MHQVFRLLPPLLLAGIVSTSSLAASTEQGVSSPPDTLRLAAGLDDTSSRMTAIGLSSLAGAAPSAPAIDTTWIGAEDDALARLDADDVELALLPIGEIGPDALDGRPDLRAVMKYWSSDEGGDETAGHLLLAKASLPSDRVEALLEVALQKPFVLKAARIDMTKLTPEDALTALPIPTHDGVVSYLGHQGVEMPPKPAARPAPVISEAAGAVLAPKPGYSRADILTARLDLREKSNTSKSFTLYFDTGDAVVDDIGFQSVAAACNYAAGLSKARFVISGHTDTVGTHADNDALSNQRASAVADAIRNDPRFREALSVIEFGEQNLAIATGDEVDEPKNRRVEITVIEER